MPQHTEIKNRHTGKLIAFFFVISFMFASYSGAAADYYWIGGTGNWSDISHWVSSSGGTTNYSQVPTPNDNVYFDANSFTAPGQVITINSTTATCQNLSFTGSSYQPDITMAVGNILKVYGSLQLIPNINFNILGKLVFEASTTGHTINMAGHSVSNDIRFDGLAGGWTLLDSLILSGPGADLILNYGSLNTNNKKVSCWSFQSNVTSTRVLNMGSSELHITGNNDFSVLVNTTNLTLNPGTSHIIYHDNNGGFRFLGSSSVNIYDVTFLGNSGLKRLYNTSSGLVSLHNLIVKSDATFTGDQQFNWLYAGKDRLYNFQSQATYTFLSGMAINTTCNSMTILRSSMKNSFATFVKNGSPIILSNVIIYDIHAQGTGGFVANSSVSVQNTDRKSVV